MADVTGCTKAFPADGEGCDGDAGGGGAGWAGVRALGVGHTCSGPTGNPKRSVWLPGEITRALLKARVMLS